MAKPRSIDDAFEWIAEQMPENHPVCASWPNDWWVRRGGCEAVGKNIAYICVKPLRAKCKAMELNGLTPSRPLRLMSWIVDRSWLATFPIRRRFMRF